MWTRISGSYKDAVAAHLLRHARAKLHRWLSYIILKQLAQPGKQQLQHGILCYGIALSHHQNALHVDTCAFSGSANCERITDHAE